MPRKKRENKKPPRKEFLRGVRIIVLLLKIEAGRWEELEEFKRLPWIKPLFKKLIRHNLITPQGSNYALSEEAKRNLEKFSLEQRLHLCQIFSSSLYWEARKKKGGKDGQKKNRGLVRRTYR